MADQRDAPGGALLWLLQFGPVLLLVALAGLAALVVVLGVVFDQRLDSVEADLDRRLRYAAPQPAPSGPAAAAVAAGATAHRRAYVPAQSHAYVGEGEGRPLAITLRVRNTDAAASLQVHSARYHDTKGALIKEFVAQPLEVAPLATLELLVGESDLRGGSGASFLVEWSAPESASPPVLEATMIGGPGISFVQRGVVLPAAPAAR